MAHQPILQLRAWGSAAGRNTASGESGRGAGPVTDVAALAYAAKSHEPQAVRSFLEAVAPAVRVVCRSVLGGDHLDLDDSVQECLMDILRALRDYRGDGPILHYVKRIALRSAIVVRKRGRTRQQRLRAFAAEASVHGVNGGAAELPSLRRVREVVDSLPQPQAETLLMRALLGFSLEEVALVTEVPLNTAKSRLRLAKESLRLRLEQEQSDQGAKHER